MKYYTAIILEQLTVHFHSSELEKANVAQLPHVIQCLVIQWLSKTLFFGVILFPGDIKYAWTNCHPGGYLRELFLLLTFISILDKILLLLLTFMYILDKTLLLLLTFNSILDKILLLLLTFMYILDKTLLLLLTFIYILDKVHAFCFKSLGFCICILYTHADMGWKEMDPDFDTWI